MEEDDSIRYQKACHAMQTGVKMMQNHEHPELTIPDGAFEASDSPKHLRVGVNASMCDQAALVKLLISKNIITSKEYIKAIADEMEEEVKRYEKRINDEIYGKTGNDGVKFKLH